MIVEGIKKIYKVGDGTVVALDGVSFNLPQTGMVFVLGKSGSGKSTLLNLLSGLDRADEGSIHVCGKDITKCDEGELSKYRNSFCGFIFQEYNLISELNVGENIKLSLQLQGEVGSDEKVKEALKQVGLEGYESRKVTELSGGQKQRIAIARAIIKDPKIIFADEPTGALDERTGKSILELLKGFSADRLVVVVTHDREFAEEYGDRIIELADGKVISDSISDEKEAEERKSEWKKPKLPIRAALKIGCSNFKYHPIRLVVTIILSVLSFTLLGVSLNFGMSRIEDIAYNSMRGYGLKCSAIYKHLEGGAPVPIKESEKAELESKLGKACGAVILPLEIELSGESDSVYYEHLPYGFAEITQDMFGFSIVGQLPKADNEIAISDFLADVLNDLNFSEADRRDLVGKKLVINGKEFVITALIDTHFDFERFASLKQVVAGTHDELITPFSELMSDSIHNFIFVSDLTGYADEGIRAGMTELFLDRRFSIEIVGLKKDDASNEIYRLNESGNYLPCELIPTLMRYCECNIEYEGKVFSDYGELFEELRGGGDYIETFEKYKDVYAFPTSFACRLSDIKYELDYDITVGGFFVPKDEADEGSMILSDELYDEIYRKVGGKYDTLFVSTGNSAVKQFVDRSGQIRLTNYVIAKVIEYQSMIGTIKLAANILAGIFAFFAITMLLNFMLQSVVDKSKIIGILKANGCNNLLLSKIFILEGIIIAAIVFVLVSLLVLLGCSLINGLFLNIFGVNGVVFPILFAIISLFSALGCLFPIFHMRNYTPIDIIVRS